MAHIHQRVNEIPQAKRRPLQLMEVCGGHTTRFLNLVLTSYYPLTLNLFMGPVALCAFCQWDELIVVLKLHSTLRLSLYLWRCNACSGEKGSLLDAKRNGADVRIVYSPLDALALAEQHPHRQVVFFGLGFETTMPSTAITLQQASAAS